MKKAITSSLLSIALLIMLPVGVFASTGTSINTGKISLDDSLVPGATYDLPNIQVSNSGTEESDYGISIEYNEVQEQLKPEAKWFHFEPSSFHLKPGEIMIVKTNIVVPTTAEAGDYFAYIEAHAVKSSLGQQGSISGAAATKLYFSVAQSSIFKIWYYGTLSYVRDNSPWTYVVLWVIAIVILYFIGKRIHLISKARNS